MLAKKDVEGLRASFPEEAVQIYSVIRNESGESKVLTGYKPQYIIERLNDCFGHDGWDFEILKYDTVGDYAWTLGRLTIYLSKSSINSSGEITDPLGEPMKRSKFCVKEQFGTSKISKQVGIGDALKGAATNSLEKCASMLDIGHDAYKGKVKAPQRLLDSYNVKAEDVYKGVPENLEEFRAELKDVCIENNITTKTALNTAIKNILKKNITADDLKNEEDFKTLINHLKTHKAPF